MTLFTLTYENIDIFREVLREAIEVNCQFLLLDKICFRAPISTKVRSISNMGIAEEILI